MRQQNGWLKAGGHVKLDGPTVSKGGGKTKIDTIGQMGALKVVTATATYTIINAIQVTMYGPIQIALKDQKKNSETFEKFTKRPAKFSEKVNKVSFLGTWFNGNY